MARPKKQGPKKVQVAVRFDPADLDRLYNMLHHTGRSLQGFLETAALDRLARIERAENQGKPFPERP
jgi:hypothetical protein